MFTNVAVWVRGVEYEDVVRLFDCLGSPIEWDELVWRMWQELGWDNWNPLREEPEEVLAYRVNRGILEKLGLNPVGTGIYVLFVFPDIEWAAVTSTAYLYTE